MLPNDVPVRRSPDVLHSRVEDTIYALDTGSGSCFAFRGPSARLWELLEEPLTAADAAGRLIREFEVEEGRCRNEVAAHLAQLHEEGLVIPV